MTQDPVVHVSVASVLGDVSTYVTSSSKEVSGASSATGVASDAPNKVGDGEKRQGIEDSGDDGSNDEDENDDDDDEGEEEEEDVEAPSEICLPVSVVLCKAGTTYFEAPLLAAG